jgi:uncharacterized linocin/CFP29 family protein
LFASAAPVGRTRRRSVEREVNMEILGRENAPFSPRVWQQIDATVNAVKMSNCTARRFLEVDGPYGLGLTSMTRDDQWLAPAAGGATAGAWDVPRALPPAPGEDPDQMGRRGTFLSFSRAEPVPLLASEFIIGMRSIEAFDDDCQPLDLARVTRAARDLALEEERLLYYGNATARLGGLLTAPNATPVRPRPPWREQQLLCALIDFAIQNLAGRGFSGPYALALSPRLYAMLHTLMAGTEVVLVDLLRELFAVGVFMVPVIQPALTGTGTPVSGEPLGAVITCARPYLRLVLGQEWTTAYRGMTGAYHRFLLMGSLRLDITDENAIQVLRMA